MMNKTTLLGMLTVATFVSAASLAVAEGTQGMPPKEKAQHHQQRLGQTLAQEQIEGKVVAVDKTKGTVSVETAQHGQLEFKLTPAQVQRMSEGEELRLQIQLHSVPKQP